ncbi:MAG: radical SAM family heme chaperone HemW [Clostridiales bacterium]|nr:radical SAM family heme chaperone HemW [Clostridiales bacterium]MCF8021459.1 radical SAM family heme chaperone HemW [Clostridiales bacterium]
MHSGIYIHVPFCLKKCNYCDFVSYPYKDEQVKKYVDYLMKEIEMRAASAAWKDRRISTIYVGGGTPTCLPEDYLVKIIKKCFRCFYIESAAEITVEANPCTVDKKMFEKLLYSGVNRLSLGVQACSSRELSFLGRIHTFYQAIEAFTMAREAGLRNIGIDLIFGIPGQKLSAWRECLQKIVAMNPEHISAYNLQIEEGTPLYRSVQKGFVNPCNEEIELNMFWDCIRILKNNGYTHYEISNFAQAGKKCAHNLNYWFNGEYLGLGLAAHSYFNSVRIANKKTIIDYYEDLQNDCLPVMWYEKINPELEMAETIFMGLRLMKGLSLSDFYNRFGCRLEHTYKEVIKKLIKSDLLTISGDNLRLTEKGIPVANAVFIEFLP